MADKKVTIMVIKVDLACEKCRKKIKKTLCKIPQIQSQIYDEKSNTVTVTVVCCSPEKIKKRICCKGGDSVKGIEIKEPPKPKPAQSEKPKEQEKPKEKPKEQEKPKETPKEQEKPKEKPKEPEKSKENPKVVTFAEPPKTAPAPAPAPAPDPVPAYPPQQVRACCAECYGGYGGGPCFQGFGTPAAPCTYEGYGTPAPCYEAYGRPVYDSWGGGGGSYYVACRRGCRGGRCECMNEENPGACSVM